MSTPVSYDQQYCPIARGLDLLGDRWTLLIVRELSAGPQRFSDLQRHLPGIAATVLSDRLRTMTDDGLVETVPSDPPSRRNRYGLGPLGRRALPVLSSLLRFGMPLLEPPADDSVVRPSLTIRGTIAAYHDPAAASGVDERYEVRVDGEAFTLDARGRVVDGGTEPDLIPPPRVRRPRPPRSDRPRRFERRHRPLPRDLPPRQLVDRHRLAAASRADRRSAQTRVRRRRPVHRRSRTLRRMSETTSPSRPSGCSPERRSTSTSTACTG